MTARGYHLCRRGTVRELTRPIQQPGAETRWGLCDGLHRDDHEFVRA